MGHNVEYPSMAIFWAFTFDYHISTDFADRVYGLSSEAQKVNSLIDPIFGSRSFLPYSISTFPRKSKLSMPIPLSTTSTLFLPY